MGLIAIVGILDNRLGFHYIDGLIRDLRGEYRQALGFRAAQSGFVGSGHAIFLNREVPSFLLVLPSSVKAFSIDTRFLSVGFTRNI